MSDLSVLTGRLDAMAHGWSERFGLIQREITQAHKWQQDHEVEAERQKRIRARNTRLWVAALLALGTALNGAFQAIGSYNRTSLRAELLDAVRREQSEREQRLSDLAAERAVQKYETRLQLLVKPPLK